MATKYRGTEEQRLSLDLLIKLARASDAVAERTGRRFERAGLTATQFGVLETLYHLGRLMPSQLAEKHLRSRNNLTVVVDKLEGNGLVQRERCPNDRRAQWVSLTDEGRKLIERIFPTFVDELVKDFSVLSADEQRQLGELLRKLGKGCCGKSLHS